MCTPRQGYSGCGKAGGRGPARELLRISPPGDRTPSTRLSSPRPLSFRSREFGTAGCHQLFSPLTQKGAEGVTKDELVLQERKKGQAKTEEAQADSWEAGDNPIDDAE